VRPPVLVYSDKNLQPVVQEMKAWAQSGRVSLMPAYSASEEEAIERAKENPAEAFQDMWTLLFLPMRISVRLALSIDAYAERHVWHLSMSQPNYQTQRPVRVPDMFSRRITRAFFPDLEVTEGPPEGAFKKVRHFRAPYAPDSSGPTH
jgi:hypothetical protein